MSDPVRVQLLGEIGSAETITALRGLRDQVHNRMEALLPTLSVEQFYDQLNEVHDALIRRVIALAEADMARMGKGSPPVPYAYLLFGSGGRQEQTLSSDQDSGIVYGNPDSEDDKAKVETYFKELASTIVASLQETGYPPCDGNVISSNPQWCMSITDWEKQLDHWFDEADWEFVRYLLIVADGRLVYGDRELARKLKNAFYSDTLAKPLIVRRMLENTMRHKMLLGVFGQLLKEQYGEEAGSIDIKYGAYIPMVNAIRLMAIQAGLRETSTLERISELKNRDMLAAEDASVYAETFRIFLKLRLITIEHTEDGMFTNNGKLAGSRLTKEMKDELKLALKTGQKLQRRVYKQTMGKLG
ncbi:DUF294 nucleotidyltransferase-like domain-containing protein [Paenibacillus abyssi]|uniref:CBS domain-containing protein n=1 Tax=Paenibacillus abyssi TaxID=1340531 RepID=A0A917FZS7_9BACL|nr:DUF294 nucleotidyltransferase-like domain-containing protein [Paenibacillus abyssi]GGG15372.1 hypothetical protein GCM10010916_35390 [Paenibacillus abyssi]